MTLREAAAALLHIATESREVAGRIDGTAPERWAIARDVRALAYSLERYAAVAEWAGTTAGEPEPDAWIRDAAPGELQEMFGR